MSSRCSACSVKWLDSFLGHCQQYRCAANFTPIPAPVICLYTSRGDKRKYRKTLRQAWTLHINDMIRDRTMKLKQMTVHPRLLQGVIQPEVYAVCCTARFFTSFALLFRLFRKLTTIYQVMNPILCNFLIRLSISMGDPFKKAVSYNSLPK